MPTFALPPNPLAAFLLTYLVHSTVLLGCALILVPKLENASTRVRTLHFFLWAGLVTTGLQTVLATGPVLDAPVAASAAPAAFQPPADPHVGGSQIGTVETSFDPIAPGQGVESATGGAMTAATDRVPPVERAATGGAPVWTLARTATGIWAALALILLLRLAWQTRRLRAVIGTRSAITTGPWKDALDQLLVRLLRPLRVSLTRASGLRTPLVLGAREICLPERATGELHDTEREALLAHELGHIARRDPRTLLLAHAIERAFFFQPLNRWVRKRLQREMELACDEWAVRQTGRPLALARCLSHIAGWLDGSPAPALSPAMAQRASELVQRVERLLERPAAPPRLQGMLAALGFGVVFTTLAIAGPRVATATGLQDLPGETAETLPVQRPTSRRVAGPASRPTSRPVAKPQWQKSASLEELVAERDNLKREIQDRGLKPKHAMRRKIEQRIRELELKIAFWTIEPDPWRALGYVSSGDERRPLGDDYSIRVGDRVRILDSIHGIDLTETVQAQGDILLPDLGRVMIAGLSRDAIHAKLSEEYARYYQETDIHVQILTAQTGYFVAGDVADPGRKSLERDQTVFEAVLAARPLPASADLARVRVIRADPVNPLVIEVDVKAMMESGDSTSNALLEAGDVIFVPAVDVAKETSSQPEREELLIRIEILRPGVRVDPKTGKPWVGEGPFRFEGRQIDYRVAWRGKRTATSGAQPADRANWLRSRVAAVLEENPHAAARIEAPAGAIYQDVTEVIDLLLESGVQAIRTEPRRR